MKPQRFEIGQAVTPRGAQWRYEHPSPQDISPSPDPRFGEIYHVKRYSHREANAGLGWGIQLNELVGTTWYLETSFDPVEITTEQLEVMISETQPVEV
jgi:hypothetical protein